MQTLTLSDFTEASPGVLPVYHRRYRGYENTVDIIVQCFGVSWGFTLWADSACLHGEKDWNWGADDAVDRAIVKAREICGNHV